MSALLINKKTDISQSAVVILVGSLSFVREDAYLSNLPVAIIRSWYQREGYVKSMADLIEKELQSFSNHDEVLYRIVRLSIQGDCDKLPLDYCLKLGLMFL